jgi:2-(1,2-epoxy-1,2-dihydrophenyl)acetyl-CoA isomerase
MTEPDSVLVELTNGIAHVRLNRPHVLNALNEEMASRFANVIGTLHNDPAVRAVMVSGEGNAFCAGGDVATFSTDVESLERIDQLIRNFHDAAGLLTRLAVPTIAVLHGAVAGAGLSLSLACDFAIAADRTKFTLAYAKLGTSPDGGSTWSLPRLVGTRKALEIACLSEVFTAEEALRLGLVTRVVPCENLQADAHAFARRLADGPTAAYGRTKRLIYGSFAASLDEQLEAERLSFLASAQTADFEEGKAAFLSKRPAVFQGR